MSDNSMASSFTSPSSAPTPPSDHARETRPLASRKSPTLPPSFDDMDHERPLRPAAVRPIQRVVSAPVSTAAAVVGPSDDDLVKEPGHHLVSTTVTEVREYNPADIAWKNDEAGDHTRPTAARSNMVTPGLAQRTMGSSTASGRRLAGLSRFGGPARRVVPQPDPDELDEDAASSAAGECYFEMTTS